MLLTVLQVPHKLEITVVSGRACYCKIGNKAAASRFSTTTRSPFESVYLFLRAPNVLWDFIPMSSTRPVGMGFSKTGLVKVNRSQTGVG